MPPSLAGMWRGRRQRRVPPAFRRALASIGGVLALIAVSLVAGAATVLAPCVLPVLPVVLAGGAGGGRRGPVGIALGLAVSFTVFTLSASRLERALGLPQDLLFHVA